MSNSDAPGPSHGKIRLSVVGLRTLQRDPERDAIYEAGAVVSFEKNPSRRWLIPFAGPSVGVFASQTTEMHAWLVSGTAGAYLIHWPVFSVALEGSYSVATSRMGDLSGPRTELHVALPRW
jgi:hypothetical protein